MDTLETTEKNHVNARSVLLVEDSSVTQDIVELMLTQAGHSVAIADDGASALAQLRDRTFDIVLTDFHLPDITGLEVVKQYLSDHPGGARPTFVAITGDVRGLLADKANCEVFDRIVPKPLDIDLICELVETPRAKPSAPARMVRAPGERTSVIEDLPFAYFNWPDVQSQTRLSGLQGIDAVLVNSTDDLPALWRTPGANLLPIIDMTGAMGPSADMDGTALRLGDTDRIAQIIDHFHDRRAELHSDIVRSTDPADRLLARIHLAGGTIDPRRSGADRSLIAWNLLAHTDDLLQPMTKLVAEGFLATEFSERVHHCPSCQSARLLVREECPDCQSPHLEEESYLHHFRCAYQGPESDFRHGDELTCPKCRRTLAHFGRDYDRPGLMVSCRGCSKTTSEPNVAFVCVDCSTRTMADAVPTRDILSGRITDQGLAYLKAGRSFLGLTRQSLRLADLPLDLVVALNRAASRFNDDRTPFVLGYVTYDNLGAVQADHGARQARDTRRLWLETFQQNLPSGTIVTAGSTHDFVLMPNADKASIQPVLKTARQGADGSLRLDVGARFDLFGPEDLAG
ncbi:Aerobic respiration control sensor protein ArcB [Jannaschia donghaensis]|uniref:Aerobic respiration control sensor protein ArcB n=1 Tax=Jannaschia donghaensis TaxID=420998 RepID=A0A0M6YJU5_9RHOB|nr:Aerobic respiration control sensor protein ArcB [Jannaschia donghaensis]